MNLLPDKFAMGRQLATLRGFFGFF